MEYNKQKRLVKCVVPNCTNNSRNSIKEFFKFPQNSEERVKWFDSVCLKVTDYSLKSDQFVCEDHFDLKNDLENFQYWSMFGGHKRLKSSILPRREAFLNITNKSDDGIDTEIEYFVEAPTFDDPEPSQKDIGVQCKIEPFKCDQYVQAEMDCNPKVSVRSKSTMTRPDMKDTSTQTTEPKTTSNIILTSSSSSNATQETSDFEYVPDTESSDDEDNVQINEFENVIDRMVGNPKFYLGVPVEHLEIADLIASTLKIDKIKVIVVLIFIKRGYSTFEIATFVRKSKTWVSIVIKNCVPRISALLKSFVFWPTKNNILKHLPIAFRYRYSNVESIIDSFEIQIEKPRMNALEQKNTFSNYKGCNTIKYLISCTPNGYINFISPGYGGRISDNEIVKQSGFLDAMSENSWIMADRGFKHIGAMLNEKGCKLVVPPSLRTGKIFDESELMESKRIASLRIHIERCIRRVKEYQILSKDISINRVCIMDDIVQIICSLINLQPSLTH